MAQYLLSLHTGADEAEPMTDEERQQSGKDIMAVNEGLKSAGAWVFGGALNGPDTATVVRVSGGKTLTIDGPFAESKEQLAGFYVIDVEDLDAALDWAAKTAAAVRQPIEVRPLRHGEA